MRLFFIAAVLSLILPPFAGFSRAFSQTLSSTPPISHASTPLVHNDFDGDGISDIVLYINQNDGSPNEYVYSFDYSSKKNSLLSNIEFGSSGDILAPGRYDGSKSDLAVVKKGVDALTWVIRSTEKDKIIEEVDFGKPGDIVVSGCDFDGDALTDLAVISDGVLKLRRSSNNNTVQIPMNLAKEAVIKDASCADIDADNKADFLLLTREKPTREDLKLVRCKKVYKSRKKRKQCKRENIAKRKNAKNTVIGRSYNLFLSEAYAATMSRDVAPKGKTIFAALDLDNDGNLETSYTRKITGATHRINFFVGEQEVPVDIPTIKDISFGTFSEGESGIMVLTKDGQLHLISLPSLETSVVITTAHGDRLLRSVNAAAAGGTTSVGDAPSVCTEFPSVGNGFLWKPVSESNGKLVVLLPSTYRGQISNVKIMIGEKNQESLAFAGDEHNGGRPHYRSFSKSGKNFENGSYVVVTLKNDKAHCFGPIENTSDRIE